MNVVFPEVTAVRGTYNGVQSSKSSTDGETTETGFRDGGVNDPLGTEAVQQTPRYLVTIIVERVQICDPWTAGKSDEGQGAIRSVVLRNLLSKNESLLVALQLLGERLVQSITDSDLLGARFRSISPEAQD